MVKFFGLIGLLLLGAFAQADVPLPPEMLGIYTVQVDSDMSRLLAESLQGQSQREVPIPSRPGCKTIEKTRGGDNSQITCLMPTYCMGRFNGSCTLRFVGVPVFDDRGHRRAQTEAELIRIVKFEEFSR